MEALIREDTDVYFSKKLAFTLRGGSRVQVPWPKGEFKVSFSRMKKRQVMRISRRLKQAQ